MDSNKFLQMLSAIDQEEYKSQIPCLDHDQPAFYWIFKNVDFEQWIASSSQVLWLSGPSQCNIYQVSSHIVDCFQEQAHKTNKVVLYFFCSTAIGKESVVTVFIHTFLSQFMCCSPPEKRMAIAKIFLHTLLNPSFEKSKGGNQQLSFSNAQEPPEIVVQKALHARPDDLWTALKAALTNDVRSDILIVVDGLDEIKHQIHEFLRGINEFLT
jgi:hypothetical protein